MQSRAMRYLWLFLTGCIAHSFFIWVGALHPALFIFSTALYSIGSIVWCIALLFNGPLQVLLGVEPEAYLMILIGSLISLVLGGAITWILG